METKTCPGGEKCHVLANKAHAYAEVLGLLGSGEEAEEFDKAWREMIAAAEREGA